MTTLTSANVSMNPAELKATPQWKIPILIFHHVAPDINYYTALTPAKFRTFMKVIAEHYTTITMDQAYAYFIQGQQPPARTVIITFDDGYSDNFDFALPILSELRLVATFYVLPKYIDKLNVWNSKVLYRCSHMSWAQVRLLAEIGCEIGNHTLHHLSLSSIPPDQWCTEIVDSKKILEDGLGQAVNSFSYPYGIYNENLRDFVSKHYQTAVSTVKSQFTNWYSHRFELRRIYIDSTLNPLEIVNLIDHY
jgi:peptidoglycan/xylan/chitin deacetylase (PgdA/CDA1 family)